MRVLVAAPGPSFSVHDVYVGWVEGLRELGAQVVEFNLDARLSFYDAALLPTDQEGKFRKAIPTEQVVGVAINGLYAALYKVRPDVLVVISGFFVPADLYERARSYGTRVVIVHTEEPYEHDRELGLAPFADVNVINDPTNLDAFTELAPTVYVPHCYRPVLHKPGPARPEQVCDLAFVGTGYPSRVAFFEAMDLAGLDVILAGNWPGLREDSPLRPMVGHELDQCLDNAQTVELYRSARAGLNLYRREGPGGVHVAGWAMGPREVEMAACQLFFLRDQRGEGDEVLGMLPCFAGPEDAGEALRWWLDHDDQRAEAALKARSAVADRTFVNAATAVLRLLD